MAAELPPIDQKGKIALGIGVALLAGAAAYWYMVWKPGQDAIDKIAIHADSLEKKNAVVKQEVADGLEGKLRADAIRYTAELNGLRKLVPTANEVGALIDAVSIAARANGMEVSEFAPDGTLPGQDFDMVKYRFGVTGPFHKVVEFLTAIASTPRILTPINVSVATSSRTMERRPGKDETFVDVKFGVLTYIAKTRPPEVQAAPPPKPATPASKPGTP